MPGPRLRMCRMNNLPPKESEPVYRSKRKNSPVNWDSALKAESFLGSGSIWCWKTSEGWGLYVRNSTQQARRNVSLSSHGFSSLCEKMRSSTDASLTWAKLQVILLGEDRLGLRFKPLPLHVVLLAWLQCRGLVKSDGLLAHQRTIQCWEGCLLFNSFRLWVQVCCYKHRDDYYRVFSHFLLFGLKDESVWSRGLASTTHQT